ncbi:MAG: hypothetical protein IJA10_15680 [Lachnospiraceae bacterium]|nr:hypothetical protein [Lachnospiraceae bacterium]
MQFRKSFWIQKLIFEESILVNSRYVVKKAFDYIELTNGKRLSISEDRIF